MNLLIVHHSHETHERRKFLIEFYSRRFVHVFSRRFVHESRELHARFPFFLRITVVTSVFTIDFVDTKP